MKNSEYVDISNLKNKLAEKVVKINDPDERTKFLKIVIDLGNELDNVKNDTEQDINFPRPDFS